MRVVGSQFGIEDVLFSFSAGGLAWISAIWSSSSQLKVETHVRKILSRTAMLASLTLTPAVFAHILINGAMNRALFTMMAAGVLLLICNRNLWKLVLPSAIRFLGVYSVVVAGIVLWLPHFTESWTVANLWGITLGGIPLEEFVWALVFGAVWPLAAGFVLNARVDHLSSVRAPHPGP